MKRTIRQEELDGVLEVASNLFHHLHHRLPCIQKLPVSTHSSNSGTWTAAQINNGGEKGCTSFEAVVDAGQHPKVCTHDLAGQPVQLQVQMLPPRLHIHLTIKTLLALPTTSRGQNSVKTPIIEKTWQAGTVHRDCHYQQCYALTTYVHFVVYFEKDEEVERTCTGASAAGATSAGACVSYLETCLLYTSDAADE